MTILIVDDEQLAVQSLLREAAQVFPPETDFLTASSGAQALELAASRPADIAFLDIEMPDMDGLELTLRLKQLHPEINIIFVTAYPAYSVSAWKLHASDYLLKPVDAGDLRAALDNLRHPLPEASAEPPERLRVQCFGNFEVFFGGKKVHFDRSGAKELFAYLVSRRGAGVTTGELCGVLWENDFDLALKKSYIRTYFASLKKTFRGCGLEGVVVHTRNSYSIDPSLLDCDYYRFLQLDPVAINSYRSEFMSQYSWAEGMVYQPDSFSLSNLPKEENS